MHNAPAVSFPVGRSRFHARFLAVAWLVGVAVCAYWASLMAAASWRHGLAVAMPLFAGAAAWAGWQRHVSGSLHWDGAGWRLETADGTSDRPPETAPGHLAVHLDFQNLLLISLRLESGGTRWLWLDQCADPARWQAFRRAVHS